MGVFRRLRKGLQNSAHIWREPPSLPGPFRVLSPSLNARSTDTQSPDGAAQTGSRRFKSLKIRLFVGLPLLAALGGISAFAAMMVYYTIVFPHPLSIRKKEHAPVVRILARDGSVLAERGAAHDYMPLDLLPRHVEAAVVATEDRRFFDHYGLDPIGLTRAFFTNLRAGRFAQGGSTISQQLAKNLFLSSERTLSRKIEELVLALWLEMRLSKSEILELYLNRVYFGGGAYGIEAASRRYFDKSARSLNLAEAALIAGLLKAPSKYSPASSPEAARTRGKVVIDKMADAGLITEAERLHAHEQRIVFEQPKDARGASGADYAIDFVLEQLPPLASENDSEVVVETTIDAGLQRAANDIVAKALARQGEALGASQAALILLDMDGGIRAIVGGKSYAESQFNRASKAVRQPGSAFKPFVFLTALEHGLRPDSTVQDLPLTIGGWMPRNDNGEYVGPVTLRRALAHSINTVSVRLNNEFGVERTISTAYRLGIRSALRKEPSLALGTSEVTLTEMTGAYAVFANGGVGITPHAITRVKMGSGRVLYARKAGRSDQIVKPAYVGAMNDMLNSVIVSGTGRRAALALHPAAGKTGTTQEFRDAWFIGYTSHLAAGVWIGNDAGKPMKRATGGGLPAEIWRQVMDVAHQGKAPLSLPGTFSVPAANEAVFAAGHKPAPTLVRAQWTDPAAEQLPWLARQAPAVQPNPNDSGDEAKAHPLDPMDEAFLARVLGDTNTEPLNTAVPEPRIAGARPSGMMLLGAWW